MATPPVLRVVEREARVFARLWRGAVFSTFLARCSSSPRWGSAWAGSSIRTPGKSRA